MNPKNKLQSKESDSQIRPGTHPDPIAIIGIGCRYPGISNPADFWQTLMAGKEAIGPYPGGRFLELDRFYEEVRRRPGRLLTDRGGFLPDVTGFDAQFFEISPRESIYLDPQHRLLLEIAQEALEDAGQSREAYEGSQTGVYVGLWTSEYESRLYESGTENDFYSITGCGRASASGRLSFTFSLQGPSLTIDTACSSSLVAVHAACQALWAEEIDMALAGGANLILGPEISELFTEAKMLSPDGRCKFGDASADGFVRSEGAGIVVLKRLAEAVADRDPIYALIRGTAANNDGHSSGFMVPSREGQQQMLRTAWESARVDPQKIRYVEMHGTGTRVGDPIEIGAVGGMLAEYGVARPCVLGSVKTNLGHTESASGVTGLIKAALAVQHRIVPQSLHFKEPNPKVDWEKIPVRVASDAVDLSLEPGRILAGVNSFGLSGTNAHVVLEEAERKPATNPQGTGPYLLPISARTPEALHALLGAHLASLQNAGPQFPIQDVCYTASARRTHYEHRIALVSENVEELESNLRSALQDEDCDGVVSDRVSAGENKVVFVAPGQGSQWLGMARELFDHDPVFRQEFERCSTAIAAETGWSLIDRVLGADAEQYLSQIDVIQPALFAMSVALAAVWRFRGIEPDAVVGHSMGEVAAAHIAGILSLEDAVAVICRRSRLMKTLGSTAGSMATVELPLVEVTALLRLHDGVSIGASNGPHTTVISGDSRAVEALLQELEAKEIYCRRIKVDVASHSALVDPILNDLLTALAGIRPQPAKIPMLSTVTGKYASSNDRTGVVMDAAYWVENLRHSVLFAPAIEELSSQGHGTFVELSPHPILLPAIEASAREKNPRVLVTASLRREKPARTSLLRGLAALFAAGHRVAWSRMYLEDARCVRLPQYPFQHERCWPEPADPEQAQGAGHADGVSPLLGRRLESSLQPNTILWESRLGVAAPPYLNDHRVLRSAVFPASAQVEMALSAARIAGAGREFELRDAAFLKAAYLPDQGRKTFQLALIPDGDAAFRFELRGRTDAAENGEEDKTQTAWTLYSKGVAEAVATDAPTLGKVSLAEVKGRCPVHRSREEQYEMTSRIGLYYGPAFQLAQEAWVGEGEGLCRLRFDAADGDEYAIHPALLDACFQVFVHMRPEQAAFSPADLYLPVSIQRIRLFGAIPERADLFAWAELTDSDAEKGMLRANLRLIASDGSVLAEVVAMELMRVAQEGQPDTEVPLWTLDWVEQTASPHEIAAQAEATVALLPTVSSENWVVFADRTGIADVMQASLTALGGRCTLVRPGPDFKKIAEAEYEIAPGQREDLDRLLKEVAIGTDVPTAVVDLWALNGEAAKPYDAEGLIAAQRVGSQQVPEIVQAIAAANWRNPPRLWLATAGVKAAGSTKNRGQNDLPCIESAPMWGIGRAVAREHAELRTTLVDLSCQADPREARALVLQICAGGKEDRIALRGGAKYVARLAQFSPEPLEVSAEPLAAGQAYRIEIPVLGMLDNLELRACATPVPGPGEIAVDVVASGLNFIDVTKVMGIYPGLDPAKPIQLGIECAGRVTAVGEGVRDYQVNDEVIVVTPSMQTTSLMASSVTVPAAMAFPKPTQWSFEEAATTPIAFLTAYYSLVELAHLRPGEWVLIHAGAGGVGLAAIEIARWMGAPIIATVGSEEKVNYLRSIGVEHILNSRSLAFASGVMEITGGRGVDVVLNSLTGEFQSKGLEVLAPYGRFIELGKRDIYEDRNVGLKVFRKNLSFHAVDLAAAIEERREYVVDLLRTVMEHMESGDWRPLPVTSFFSVDPSVPFRFMAQARHIGKISIRMDRDVRVLPAVDKKMFSADATYLITGGLGGVALRVARWMACNGAGHLVLLSRRAVAEESAQMIREMERQGARVTAVRADVTRAADLEEVLRKIHASGMPLKGIMHTAAVVDDVLVRDASPERFLPVMAPKITGSWNLHMATRQEDLDFFVLFSSVAAFHPQPGMGSYAAANAFLDSFASYLRSLGRPAISVNWGGWNRIGLAQVAGTERSIEAYTNEGMRAFSEEEALEVLRHILENRPVQTIAIPIDAEKFVKFHGPNDIPPVLDNLVSHTRANSAAQSSRAEILDRLSAADSARQRQDVMEGYLQEVLGRVLKLATRKIDRQRPLGSMGLDSLMGLEFVRRISGALEIAVPATVVFNYPTIQLLATHLLRRMQLEPAAGTAPGRDASADTHALENTDGFVSRLSGDLSEEDALQALMGNGQKSS